MTASTREDLVRAFGTYLHSRCGDAIDFDSLGLLSVAERLLFDELLDRIVERRRRGIR